MFLGKPVYCLSAALTVLMLTGQQSVSQAATATANSGSFLGRWYAGAPSDDSATWKWSTPTAKDTITWTSGINVADSVPDPLGKKTFGPEGKFNVPLVGPVTGRAFTGFVDSFTGPLGSTADTNGEGKSFTKPGVLFGTNYVAEWSVTANGTLGGGAAPNWSSQATGKDPWSISSAQLTDIGLPDTESVFDLFFTVGLTSAKYSANGGVGLDVSYSSVAGTVNLLNIALNANQVNVTGISPSELDLYLLSDVNEGPTEILANLITLPSLQAKLQNDVFSDRNLDTPIYLGLVWRDVSVPRVDFGDGTVAKIGVNLGVSDAAAKKVPVPSSFLGMLAFGALGTVTLFNRKLKQNRLAQILPHS